MIFHGLTGYSTILSYSTLMFTELNAPISPVVANILLGVISFFFNLFAPFIIRRFSRRSIIISGHVLMSIFQALVAVCYIKRLAIEAIVMIISLVVTINVTNSAIVNLYVTEIAVDSSIGMVNLISAVQNILLIFIAPYMVV